MFTLKKSLTGIFLLTSLWHGSIQAQGVTMYSDRAPSAEEMANILFSTSGNNAISTQRGGIKMRSISFGRVNMPEPILSQAQNTSQSKNSIGLPIKFGYNSAEILPESLPFLDQVGKMLGMADYSQKKLVVEGHTDAVGSKSYNQYLSEKRAEAVKSYLKSNYSIANNRLIVKGMGENQPLSGVNPFAALNRRVQFYSVL